MPGKGKGKRNQGQCLTLISEGNHTRTFILQCEFFDLMLSQQGYTTGIIYQPCTEFCDFFKHQSYGTFNFPRSCICFNLVKVVTLESFHTSLPFTTNETDIREHEKQRSIKEHYAVSLLRYYFGVFRSLPFFFREGHCPFVLNV